MKVFYFDSIYKNGHIALDKVIIQAISEVADTIYISPDGWYNDLSSKIVQVGSAKKINSTRIPRIELIKTATCNIFKAKKILKENNVDIIVMGECEILTLPVYLFCVGRKKMRKTIIVHHQDLDSIRLNSFLNRFRKWIFNKYKNSFVHCVLEPFIMDTLIKEYSVKKENVVCWRHPMYKKKIENGIRKYDCASISHSNDEKIVQEIIKLEKEKSIFKKSNIHMLLRTNLEEFDDGYLKAIHKELTYDDYCKIFDDTSCVFLPLGSTFYNRVSGVAYDAFSRGIPVIGSHVPVMLFFNREYSEICFVSDPLNFIEVLKKVLQNRPKETEFEKCIEDHSYKQLCVSVKENLEGIIKKYVNEN